MSALNSTDIIKAIEAHRKGECHNCPYEGLPRCLDILCGNTVKFIKAMQGAAEAWKEHSKTLEKENETLKTLLDESYDTQNSLTKEKERWRAEAENQSVLWRQHFESIYETAKGTVKADTVRKIQSELQERCIKGGIYPAYVARTIDQIAKEMLEGINNESKIT